MDAAPAARFNVSVPSERTMQMYIPYVNAVAGTVYIAIPFNWLGNLFAASSSPTQPHSGADALQMP